MARRGEAEELVRLWQEEESPFALIAAILLQARGTGLSGTFGGDSAVYRSRRGVERRRFFVEIPLFDPALNARAVHLGHEAGLVVLDQPLTLERLKDLDDVARLLARQKPAWPPGTRDSIQSKMLISSRARPATA